jgi:hypothetical protein
MTPAFWVGPKGIAVLLESAIGMRSRFSNFPIALYPFMLAELFTQG